MSEELKPCPFCGGKAYADEAIKGGYVIACSDCGRTAIATMDTAVRLWNTRTKQPDTPEQVRYIDDAYQAGWKACERERAERTCHYEYEDVSPLLGEGTYRIRRCSECTQALKPAWKYCPDCGARVEVGE